MLKNLKQIITVSTLVVFITIAIFAVNQHTPKVEKNHQNFPKTQESTHFEEELNKLQASKNPHALKEAKVQSFDIKKDISNYQVFNKYTTDSLYNNPNSEILFRFIQKDALARIEADDSDENNPYRNLGKSSVWAVGFDIDNDNEEEIIGQYADYPYNGIVSGILFIIKKHQGDYKAMFIDEFVVNITEIRLAKNLKTKKNVIILTHFDKHQEVKAYSVYEF